MLPVIAIVGRPNVGKSTLFNVLTKKRDALVADLPGLTRDRIYAEGMLGDKPYIAIDTGGIGGEDADLENLMEGQTMQAIHESDAVLFLVDGRSGLTAADEAIVARLRGIAKKLFLVVNKIDGIDPTLACAEFYQLGIGEPYQIAATHGRGVTSMINQILSGIPENNDELPPEVEQGIKLAIIGRPNVGKSTLVNRILGEDRVVVFDMPGTTRDSIYIPIEKKGKQYTIIDTAGVRRRGKVTETVEKFSVIKTLQAIEDAHVVIAVFDAAEGITDQDLKMLGFVLEAGRALVVAINKWDGLTEYQRKTVHSELDRRLGFVDFAKTHFISALHGTGVGDLFRSVNRAYSSAMKQMSTSQLTQILQQAVTQHSPPVVRGRRIKLNYANPGGNNPPIVVVHGNQVDSVPKAYQRYLSNTYRKVLKLEGTPLRVVFKQGQNPYEGKAKPKVKRGMFQRKKK